VSAFAFAVPVLVIVGGWTLQNGVRYDDYTLPWSKLGRSFLSGFRHRSHRSAW
jgi:hypothetical protein